MKKTRYTEEQIAYALKQAETGIAVAEVLAPEEENEKTGNHLIDRIRSFFNLQS